MNGSAGELGERGSVLLDRLGVSVGAILELENLAEEQVVYVSGSMVEGMGNEFSDIDVFVIGDRRPEGLTLHGSVDCVYSVHLLGKRRVDFTFWHTDSVARLAHNVSTLLLRDDNPVLIYKRLPQEEGVFIHRLRVGVPLVSVEAFSKVQAQFEFNKLAEFYYRLAIHGIDNALEDLYGMMGEGAQEIGLMRARDLLNHVCDAYCHSLGNTNPPGKWRAAILDRMADTPGGRAFRERFWELQLQVTAALRRDVQAYRAYMKSCIQFANQVVDDIQG